ncbi:MAG: DegQ family serine endoprotease [Mesorhizobium sp.]|nr:DegQ family serine endoprotease [Mesorhizobium sp.]
MARHFRFVALRIALGAALALAPAHAMAQDGPLGSLLEGLLRGSPEAPVAEDGARRVPFSEREMQLSFAPLVREAAPAVVNVYASQNVQARSPFAGDPFFEKFFFGRQVPPRVESSLGSGVLVEASGVVITNRHVIRNADEVRVALHDGREYQTEILLTDESLDLAVLKLESDGPFPTAELGDSDALEVGDLVLAIGNPFGVGQTTTSGIVSGLARSHIGVTDFGFFIQTDAAINPGNSGGALVAMNGEVVGINTAIYSQTGGSIGIGFAIPSNMARAVLEAALRGDDYFERPYIGASFQQVGPQEADALGLDRPQGALVTGVVENGPAYGAGLRSGDVILTMNGATIEHPDALGYRLATQPIGSTARLGVLSRGEEREVTFELARAPDGGAEVTIDGRSPFSGARVAELSPRLAQRLRLPTDTSGVAVVEVTRNTPAAELGLRPRDIVREVNGYRIDSAEALRQVTSQQTRQWLFTVERDGRLLRQRMIY